MRVSVEVFGWVVALGSNRLSDLEDGPEESDDAAEEVSDTYLGNQSSFGGFGFQRPDFDEPENRWTPGGAY